MTSKAWLPSSPGGSHRFYHQYGAYTGAPENCLQRTYVFCNRTKKHYKTKQERILGTVFIVGHGPIRPLQVGASRCHFYVRIDCYAKLEARCAGRPGLDWRDWLVVSARAIWPTSYTTLSTLYRRHVWYALFHGISATIHLESLTPCSLMVPPCTYGRCRERRYTAESAICGRPTVLTLKARLLLSVWRDFSRGGEAIRLGAETTPSSLCSVGPSATAKPDACFLRLLGEVLSRLPSTRAIAMQRSWYGVARW